MSPIPQHSDFPMLILLYLDPGTGSLLLQLLLAALLTVPVVFRKCWTKIINFGSRALRRMPRMPTATAKDNAGPNPPQH
jgi:hypothetical protein